MTDRPSLDDVYTRFIAEPLTISADMSAAAVVGEMTRAVRRAQNAYDDDMAAMGQEMVASPALDKLLDAALIVEELVDIDRYAEECARCYDARWAIHWGRSAAVAAGIEGEAP